MWRKQSSGGRCGEPAIRIPGCPADVLGKAGQPSLAPEGRHQTSCRSRFRTKFLSDGRWSPRLSVVIDADSNGIPGIA